MFEEIFPRLVSYAGFGQEDLTALRHVHAWVTPSFPGIVEDFYRRALQDPATRRVLLSDTLILRLKARFIEWLSDLFTQPRDQDYRDRRIRIGRIHSEIGLPTAYVFAAMPHVRIGLEEALDQAPLAVQPMARRARESLNRALDIDLALISGSYHETEKARELIESSPDMIATVDRHGVLLDANRTLFATLGTELKALLGQPLETIAIESTRPSFRQALRDALVAPEGRAEIRLPRPRGGELEVEVTARGCLDPFTRRVGRILVYLRDVTQARETTRRLLESQSLVRLGELAAVVAHEVKNPLAGILGALEIIRERVDPGTDAPAIIDEILQRLAALDATVNDLLLFARPRRPVVAPCDLRELVASAAELLRRDPATAGTEVAIEGALDPVAVDAQLLAPVLLNLLLNAAQAGPPGRPIRVRLAREGLHASLSIEDEGPGVPAEIRSRIFEPFFTTKRRGTGLGLAIARRVVELHGGSIGISDRPGGGTTVELRLPLLGPAE
jgi:PAS domain S-box-containing protein